MQPHSRTPSLRFRHVCEPGPAGRAMRRFLASGVGGSLISSTLQFGVSCSFHDQTMPRAQFLFAPDQTHQSALPRIDDNDGFPGP